MTYTDFITGEKPRREPRHTADPRHWGNAYLPVKVEMWCAQFGLALTIPNGCEYQQLRDKQEA